MHRVFICGPRDTCGWITRVTDSRFVHNVNQCDIFVVSLYALGTSNGVKAIQLEHIRNNTSIPAGSIKILLLIDTYTQNQYISGSFFDYIIHPYREFPYTLDTLKSQDEWFVDGPAREHFSVSPQFIYMPVFAVYQDIIRGSLKDIKNPRESTQTCAFISSHPTPMRSEVIHWYNRVLDQHYPLMQYGRLVDNPIEYGPTTDTAYIHVCEAYKHHKYALIIETTLTPGYISEKLFLALGAGCIPIYFGAPDVCEFVQSKYYVDASRLGTCNDFGLIQAQLDSVMPFPCHLDVFDALTPYGKQFLTWKLTYPDIVRTRSGESTSHQFDLV